MIGNPQQNSLRREVPRLIGYGLALAFVTACLFPFLLETVARWVTPHTWQPSLDVTLHMSPFTPGPMMLSLVPCLLYLLFSGRKNLRGSTIRVGLVALMFVMIASTFTTLSEGRTILDRAFLEALAPLRVGMPRSEVEALVLQSNRRVLSIHDTGVLQREALEEFRKELQAHWERAQFGSTGQLVFKSLIIPLGLFAQGNPHEQAEVYVKRRYYEPSAGTYYILGLRFDAQDRLESASYKREQLSHGSVVQCDVMFQRPAPIPSPCNPDSTRKS